MELYEKTKIYPSSWDHVGLYPGVFLSGGMLLRDLSRSAWERAANERLAQRVEQMSPTVYPSPGETISSPEQEEPQRNYRPLLEENQHLAAWLTIEGTGVDYPVLYTPEEPEYYLRRAFDGSYAVSGSLFIGADCVPDGSNVLIYDHEMKDGSMFGELDRYAQEEYARAHPEIFYDREAMNAGPFWSWQPSTARYTR